MATYYEETEDGFNVHKIETKKKYQKHVNSIKKAFELDEMNLEPNFADYPQLSEKSKEPSTNEILTNEHDNIKTVEEQIKERMDRLDKRFDSIEQKLNEIIENNKSNKVDWEYKPVDVPFYNYTWPVDIPDPCKNCTNHPSNGGSVTCNCTCHGFNIT